jgi:hypothetical protein
MIILALERRSMSVAFFKIPKVYAAVIDRRYMNFLQTALVSAPGF